MAHWLKPGLREHLQKKNMGQVEFGRQQEGSNANHKTPIDYRIIKTFPRFSTFVSPQVVADLLHCSSNGPRLEATDSGSGQGGLSDHLAQGRVVLGGDDPAERVSQTGHASKLQLN